MSTSVRPVTSYRAAQVAARAAAGRLSADAARRVEAALRDYVRSLQRQLRRTSRNAAADAATRAAIRINRMAANRLQQAMLGAVESGRQITFATVADIWQQTSEDVVAAGITDGAFGAIGRARLSLLAAYETTAGSRHWTTALRTHVRSARRDMDRLIRDGITSGTDPEALARQLMPYVAGSEPFHRAFPRGAFAKLHAAHKVDPARLNKEAARQMRYNARRIAYSELHNARMEAELQHFRADPYIVAVQWTLSPDRGRTRVPDICDVLAASDYYGLGAGIYPLDKVPLPPHPFDRCEIVPVDDLVPGQRRLGLARNPRGFAVDGEVTPEAIARLQREADVLLAASESAAPPVEASPAFLSGAKAAAAPKLDAPLMQRFAEEASHGQTEWGAADDPLPPHADAIAKLVSEARAAAKGGSASAVRAVRNGFAYDVRGVLKATAYQVEWNSVRDDIPDNWLAWHDANAEEVGFGPHVTTWFGDLLTNTGRVTDPAEIHGLKSILHEFQHAVSEARFHLDKSPTFQSFGRDIEEGLVEWRAQELTGHALWGDRGVPWQEAMTVKERTGFLNSRTYLTEVDMMKRFRRLRGAKALEAVWQADSDFRRRALMNEGVMDTLRETADVLRYTPARRRKLEDLLRSIGPRDLPLAWQGGLNAPGNIMQEIEKLLLAVETGDAELAVLRRRFQQIVEDYFGAF